MAERGTLGTLIVIAVYLLVAALVLGVTWMRTGRADQAVTIVVTVMLLVVPVVAGLAMFVMPDRRGLIFFGSFWAFFVLPFVGVLLWVGPQAWMSSSSSGTTASEGAAESPSAAAVPKFLASQPMALRKGAESSVFEMWSDRVTTWRTVFVDEAVAEETLQESELRGGASKPARLGHREGWIREMRAEGLTVWNSREGRELLQATAPDEATLQQHFAARDAAKPAPVAAPKSSGLVTAPGDPLGLERHWPRWLAGMVLYTLVIVLFFFRASSIATTYGPDAGVATRPAALLKAQLLALNRADLPIKVSPAERPDEVLVDWRFDDATWLDLARVRHVNRVFRYRLRLDESDHTVRVLEYSASFDVSAGWDGTASLNFQAQRGITFFERSSETVFGLQLGRKPGQPPLHYTWRFDVDEMRIPLRETVTASGWTWKQVMLIAPWLTG
ncbi:hypothetical protein DFR24_3064 [Panacagrimonas perspica]|uniref:Uncharacterized protein n=1 Tax=Panacagrimonas perspica TaxID=381431 RepID=A0A4R7P5K7_9GAMM|nr:hypothetical protein [Panacagrimonas perspica]TDU28689.1 hypothetical protein DFR24_3064 [Panacagrimonas perspica]THD05015.1 hypothetical protein B1810_03465 [Panacagrimonas perspica]